MCTNLKSEVNPSGKRRRRWSCVTIGIEIVLGLLMTFVALAALWNVGRRGAREEFLSTLPRSSVWVILVGVLLITVVAIYLRRKFRRAEHVQQLVEDCSTDPRGRFRGDPLRIRQIITNLVGNAVKFTEDGRVSFDSPYDAPIRQPGYLAGLSVLVVDDNNTNRFLMEKILTHWDMRPTLVESGPEALRALLHARENEHPFPLVLLDVNMPEMDGFEVARRIKDDPCLSGTTIVMLSSAGQREHAARCRALGVSAYITKPIRQSFLLNSILEVLDITPAVKKTSLSAGMYPNLSSQERLNLRVLLAEDNTVNQVLAQTTLEGLGCRVTAVDNGQKVLELWKDEPHDVILMDVEMPVMNGLEATREIRNLEKITGEHVPIIAMTAHALKEDRRRGLEAGMDGYVAKPVRGDDLLRTIQQTLQQLREQAEANSKTAG